MDESAPPPPSLSSESPSPAAAPGRRSRLRLVIAIICISAGLFGAGDYLVASLHARDPYMVAVPVSVLVLVGVTAALLIGGAVAHFVQQWKRQVRRMRESLEQALAGTLLIEELEQPFGGLSPLRPVLQE